MHPNRIVALAILIALPATGALAQATSSRVTFYKDVSSILQENCQECHRPAGTNYGGMIAPMSLIAYEEVRPWAKSIVVQVVNRNMPPWDASPEHNGVFKNERTLTEAEIGTIEKWVANGAPRGNPKDAPAPREFENQGGWMIGEPDLIVQMPEPFFVNDDVYDLYTAFNVELTDAELPEDVWITAFQCKPDSNILHHFNCMILAPKDGKLPPPAGFPDTEHGEIAPSTVGGGQYIGGVSSGTDANLFPEGFGYPLKRGSRVTFDIHYHKEPGPDTAVTDQSSIGFKLTSTPPSRKINQGGSGLMATFAINIPPGAPRHQLGPVWKTLKQESEIMTLMPHMHLRGTEAIFEATYPDGTTEVLLHVPKYDFSWQTVYYFNEPKRVPANTKISYTAWYDNSPEMAERRNFDSNQTVTFGPASTDEMMMGFMMAAPVEDDE